VAEAIRRQVEQPVSGSAGGRARAGDRGRVAGPGRPVTVSVGVASFPDDAQVDLELIRIADQRLYQAKSAGRNLVCSS
jgi:GGDEF domain-containing protein